jgi:hypothetical protein
MEPVTLPEAAVRLHKSERTIRRMVERGELEGRLVLEDGRYRWAITLPELTVLPAVAERPDLAAQLARIEAKLDQLLAAQAVELPQWPAPAGIVPLRLEPAPHLARRSWWQRLFSGP